MLADYFPSLLEGTWVTLSVAGASLAIAVVFGLAGAAARLSRSTPARALAVTYTTVIRGVPELVLMLLIFFGGQVALNWAAQQLGHDEYIDINPFMAGVATIGFIYGAYLTETFRGALMAIPPGQREAGLAFGMTPLRVMWRITLPQMIRLALPGFTNNWLVLVKSTAIVSVIGLSDMMQRAGFAAGATQKPFTFYLAAAGLYLAITSLSMLLLGALNRRYAIGVREARA